MKRILVIVTCGMLLFGCSKKVIKGIDSLDKKMEDVIVGNHPKPVIFPDADFASAIEEIRSVVVYFDLDSDEIQPMSVALLEGFLEENHGKAMVFEGHACPLGEDGYNADLSRRRAERARNSIIGAIDKWGSSIVAYGESKPVTLNGAEYAKNRRVEIKIKD